MKHRRIGILVLVGLMMFAAFPAFAGDSDIIGEWIGKHGDEEIKFTFGPDNSLIVAVGGGEIIGTYQVDYNANPVTLDMTLDFGGTMKTSYTVVEFLEANKLKMEEPSDERPVSFEKDPVTFMRQLAEGAMPEQPKPVEQKPAEGVSSGGQEYTAVPMSIGDVWKK